MHNQYAYIMKYCLLLLSLCHLCQLSAQELKSIYYDSGELKSKGEFINDQPIGEWLNYHKSGTLQSKGAYYGIYIDPENNQEVYLRRGSWTFYFENGKKESEGTFEKHIKVGIWTYYHPSGKPKFVT